MIVITSPVAPAAAAPRGRPRGAAAAGFALEPEAPRAEAAVEVAGPPGLGAMLALQEAGEVSVRDREARRHGQALLAALAALQRAMLGGAGGTEQAMQDLAELAEQTSQAADPGLAAIVEAIAVRARVELARLETRR